MVKSRGNKVARQIAIYTHKSITAKRTHPLSIGTLKKTVMEKRIVLVYFTQRTNDHEQKSGLGLIVNAISACI